MRVSIAHTTRHHYSQPVVEEVMDVRLGPLTDDHQRWLRYDLKVTPNARIRRYTDGFGNEAHIISVAAPHDSIEVVSGGEVTTLLEDPFARPAAPPAPLTPLEQYDYCRPSPQIALTDELRKLAEPHRPARPDDTFQAAQSLMHVIYTEFEYQPNSTTVSTTIPEVLAGRRGVCQDFAHLLIGLCRVLEIPARYVSGYIVTASQTQSQSLGGMSQSQSLSSGPDRGGGASHAWAEVYTPTHGWRGFDPTNDLVASAHHVKMATGRDYGDVPPTRGAYRGNPEDTLEVTVEARRIAG